MLTAFMLAVLAQGGYSVSPGFVVVSPPKPASVVPPAREAAGTKPRGTNAQPTPAAERVTVTETGDDVRTAKGERVRIGDTTPRKVAAPAASFTIYDASGNPIASNAYVPGPAPDDRQWVTDTAHPGWQGFGRINAAGWLVDVTEWRRVAAEAPATFDPTWPALTRPMPPRIEWRPPPFYFAPPALGGCSTGQCGSPAYMYRRGFFGTR